MSNYKIVITIQFFLFAFFCYSQENNFSSLPGFSKSNFLNEQEITFNFDSEIRIHINAPSPENFKKNKPIDVVLFALPNGNTIEQTIGKILTPGDDWHFDIQHIGAQTRYLRNKIKDYNLIITYLETSQKSWPAWKSKHPDYTQIIKSVVDSVLSFFKDYDTFLILTGHSGGGRFIFSYLDAYDNIPSIVKRICFLDSDYGYEKSYGEKLTNWLKESDDHFLSVLAYNDSIVIYNGKPLVSPTGGTWYRSKMMKEDLSNNFDFITEENEKFITYTSSQGRIKIILKKNPDGEILHTVQVEKNGFVHTMLTGTPLESKGYEYFGNRVYDEFIQP